MPCQKQLNLFFPEWQGCGRDNKVLFGARQIRQSLASRLNFVDVPVPEEDELILEHGIVGYSAILRLLRATRLVLANHQPGSTFLIGGTCGSELGPVSYLNWKYSSQVAVIWFDAHADLNTPDSSPSKHFHGMPLRMLLGDGPEDIVSQMFSQLNPRQVVLVGVRDMDPPERQYVDANNVACFGASDSSLQTDLIHMLRQRGLANLYIHVDVDVLEPNEFPHVLMPTPDGLSFPKLLDVLESLSDEFHIVGSSIVEYVPRGEGALEKIDQLVRLLCPDEM